ncbi:MAG TPA: GNAT family N-acetyltransferase [Geminicoccaceae bacterium]|nr:GNAT family N-acetyltransferase [Geminicoccaceae bacterium]
MTRIAIREARSAAELEQAQAIRCAVFVAEQGVAEAREIDGRDATARHLLALRHGDPIGTLRLRWLDGGRTVKIERVAVLAAARGQKVGQALIGAALDLARAEGAAEARLHAQTTVQAFYARLGFVAFGPVFEEDGILHIAMRRALTDRAPRSDER